jgi:UDPglucose 6-dehydrogenase
MLKNNTPMQIAVVGSGYVGLVAGACFAELGHNVIVVDCDRRKIADLNAGEVPIHEEFLPELLTRHRGQRLHFSWDLPPAVRSSQVVFIAVGTPPMDDGCADLSYVESVARDIARATDSYKVVVEKSTVPVYTSHWIRKVMLLNGAPAELFDVASNPEFLREGTAVTDFLYPDRIVIGADNERCAEIVAQLYGAVADGSYAASSLAIPRPINSVVPPPIIRTSTNSAEIIKHASNAFLAMKISFINAVAAICERVGADIDEVRQGVGSDSRIGSKFLNAGIGYGGSCFPKDVAAFTAVARDYGYEFRLLSEVSRINEEQRQRFLSKVRNALWTVKGKRLAVLGLAFKGGTDDLRQSPAIPIVQDLLKQGGSVTAYDPAAISGATQVFSEGAVAFAASAYEAADGADALLILTDWEDFANLDLERLRHLLHYPIVIDGRNLYDPAHMADAGFIYHSMGRVAVPPRVSVATMRGAKPTRAAELEANPRSQAA